MVFLASTATCLTAFGLVPLQAGIFSTEKVTRTLEQDFLLSQNSAAPELQTSTLFTHASQSAYGITRLNETLPEFMTLNYTLTPFSPTETSTTLGFEETWTSTSRLFDVDLVCRHVPPSLNSDGLWYNITDSCKIVLEKWVPNVIGDKKDWAAGTLPGSELLIKTYSTFLTAKWASKAIWPGGWRGSNCTSDSLFFAAFLHNLLPKKGNATSTQENSAEPYEKITAISCMPQYYERLVEATVDAKTKTPITVKFLGTRTSLAEQTFNATAFEHTLIAAMDDALRPNRSESVPLTNVPRYSSGLYKSDLTSIEDWPEDGGYEIHPIAAMAISNSNHVLGDFLDPEVFATAFEAVYKLHFARAMNSILQPDFSQQAGAISGTRHQRVEAVILQPIFTHIVQALLGLVSLCMIALLFFPIGHNRNQGLCDDPGMPEYSKTDFRLI